MCLSPAVLTKGQFDTPGKRKVSKITQVHNIENNFHLLHKRQAKWLVRMGFLGETVTLKLSSLIESLFHFSSLFLDVDTSGAHLI